MRHSTRHRRIIPGVKFTQTNCNDSRNTNCNRELLKPITCNDGKIHTNVICYSFNKFGNYTINCPD